MTVTQRLDVRIAAWLIAVGTISMTGVIQGSDMFDTSGGPLTGPPVVGAPFSADATTTLTWTSSDGMPRQVSAMARYYRDSSGRVRVEQVGFAEDGPNASSRTTFITIDAAPGRNVVTLDPSRRIVRPESRGILGQIFNGGSSFAIPVDASRFRFRAYITPVNYGWVDLLRNRQIAGIETTGRRAVTPIPVGRVGNSRPQEIVDERWVSPELNVVIYARTSDPVTGVFEYRLANIDRAEPSPDLFVVPPDYTMDRCPLQADPCFASEPMLQANRSDGGRGQIVE
jgi:hypothetical protein